MNAVLHRDVFTFGDVVYLTGLTERTAKDWRRRGIIQASLRPSRKGVDSLFSFADLLFVWVAASLRQHGAPLQTIKQAMTVLHSTKWDFESPNYVLAIVGGDVELTTPGEVNRQLSRGVPLGHIDLLAAAERLRAEVDAQLAEREQAQTEHN